MSRTFRCWLPSIASALALATLPAPAEQATLLAETSLRTAPGAPTIAAFLTPAIPVEVVEQQDDWVRVRIEGWVRAEALGASAAPPAPPAAAPSPESSEPRGAPAPPPAAAAGARVTPPPAPPPPRPLAPAGSAAPALRAPVAAPVESAPPAGPLGSVEGLVRIRLGHFNKVSSAGIPILLLPGDVELDSPGAAPEPAARLAELDAELLRLDREVERAMSKSNFGEAIQLRDELNRQRDAVMAERLDILAAEHGRKEQAARAAALATTTSDSKGWFGLPSVPPGTYKLYARLTRETHDFEWIETVSVGSLPLRVELDETKAHGLPPDFSRSKAE